jgi:site-specific recombinase XerD
MGPSRLSALVQRFFEQHLPVDRNASPNTVLSYRDTMLLFLQYVANSVHTSLYWLSVNETVGG